MSNTIIVQVEKIVPNGKGLARHEGKVIFVESGLPGEELEVEITKSKKDFAEAKITSILKESPRRRIAPCSYYGQCGGCDFQHLDYDSQLSFKRDMILDSMTRLAKVDLNQLEMVASPEWSYRHRARFSKFKDVIGYQQRSGNRVVPIDHCKVLEDELNTILASKALTKRPLSSKEDPKKRKRSLIEDYPVLSNGQDVIIGGANAISMTVNGRNFQVGNSVFFQSNRFIVGDLVDWVLKQCAADDRKELAIDLFSGVGFFAAFLADQFQKVIAVERNKKCLDFASQNCSSGVEFYTGAAEEWVEDHPHLSVDFLVVDPPREGIDISIIKTIHHWKPNRWVYVSCNPVTLARDLRRILDLGDYEIVEAKGFDFYPQTSHVEVAISFIRR